MIGEGKRDVPPTKTGKVLTLSLDSLLSARLHPRHQGESGAIRKSSAHIWFAFPFAGCLSLPDRAEVSPGSAQQTEKGNE